MKRQKRQKRKGCGHFNLDECCMDCAELLHEWNFKLQDIGFSDIELMKESRATRFFKDEMLPTNSYEEKTIYYGKIREAFQKEKFESKTHEFILRKTSEGSKITEIVRALDSQGKSIYRGTVRFIIRRFENKWGIRQWNMRQMDLKEPTG